MSQEFEEEQQNEKAVTFGYFICCRALQKGICDTAPVKIMKRRQGADRCLLPAPLKLKLQIKRFGSMISLPWPLARFATFLFVVFFFIFFQFIKFVCILFSVFFFFIFNVMNVTCYDAKREGLVRSTSLQLQPFQDFLSKPPWMQMCSHRLTVLLGKKFSPFNTTKQVSQRIC